jgi:hypothetical protein
VNEASKRVSARGVARQRVVVSRISSEKRERGARQRALVRL